jgi:uncharacterized protein (TIGR02301 family)
MHGTEPAPRSATIMLVLCACLIFFQPLSVSAQLSEDNKPYDNKLMRLSEILGAIHYLRELCGAREGQVWRDQMNELIESEGTTAIRRAKLVKGFNKGYRGYRRTYRTCTEPAKTAIDRFVNEGVAISAALLKENQ